jgi:tRNA (cmo5U34)-methyltransferase
MDEGDFSMRDDMVEEFDDSLPHVTYYTDGEGRWLKRVWAVQCPETILFRDRCQGVAGHVGDHWCYLPDGS